MQTLSNGKESLILFQTVCQTLNNQLNMDKAHVYSFFSTNDVKMSHYGVEQRGSAPCWSEPRTDAPVTRPATLPRPIP